MTTRVFLINDTVFADRPGRPDLPIFIDNYQCDTAMRPHWQGGNTFCLSDSIDQWFKDVRGPNYYQEVSLQFVTDFPQRPAHLCRNHWVLDFSDPRLALLFKLRWGGK